MSSTKNISNVCCCAPQIHHHYHHHRHHNHESCKQRSSLNTISALSSKSVELFWNIEESVFVKEKKKTPKITTNMYFILFAQASCVLLLLLFSTTILLFYSIKQINICKCREKVSKLIRKKLKMLYIEFNKLKIVD